MTATNHTLTGITLLASATHPLLLPVAFLSHFVCDALPHFGMGDISEKPKLFLVYLAIDAGFAASLLCALLFLQPDGWQLMIAGGILAASPDLMWIPNFFRTQQGKKEQFTNAVERFHSRIQWSETPKGMLFEVAWLGALFVILSRVLW
jgi:hypothetical protein